MPDQLDVQLTPELRGTYLAVEALSQVIAGFHATSDILEILADYDPRYVTDDREMAEKVLREGPLGYLHDEASEGTDRVAVLDILTEWRAEFAHSLGEALGDWLEAHDMPPHVHVWVNLPGIGFMPATCGWGEEPNLEMPIPLGYLFGDKDPE